jgi:hypothetical protein
MKDGILYHGGKMSVSLFGSCIRAENWLSIYEKLSSQNDIDFELVFSGHIRPNFALPDNFKYIYANVKPPQCWSIAARESKGHIVSNFGDDIDLSEHALDKAYEAFLKENNSKAVIVPEFYHHNQRTVLSSTHYLVTKNSSTPIVPQALAFYDREFFLKLNGSDRRFAATLGDYDLYLQAMKKGAYLVFCDDIWQRHSDEGSKGKKNQSLLYKRHRQVDRPLLYSLWLKEGNFVDRTSHHKPFIYDDTIYTVNQGTSWTPSKF